MPSDEDLGIALLATSGVLIVGLAVAWAVMTGTLGRLLQVMRPRNNFPSEPLPAAAFVAVHEQRPLQPPEGYAQWLYGAGTSWSALSGVAFEQALTVCFRKLGYRVQQTPVSGDMGVDLILTSASGQKVAVQAKGYPSGARVSFKAVQEVHTGAHLFGCHSALVITNSRFTKPALRAAGQLVTSGFDIRLIDGDRLADVMAGRVPF